MSLNADIRDEMTRRTETGLESSKLFLNPILWPELRQRSYQGDIWYDRKRECYFFISLRIILESSTHTWSIE